MPRAKSEGFVLSMEVLIAATAFSMTAALVWGLVWNGLNRFSYARQRLETISFLKSGVYESDFYKSAKDILVKDNGGSDFKSSLKVERTDVSERSTLGELGGLVKRFEFKEKVFGEREDPDAQALVAYFPYFLED